MSRINPGVVVSEFAKKALTYYWNNPAGKNPAWFNKRVKKMSVRNYIANYFEFPTPGKSIRHITGRDRKRFLYRWHKEYSYFSQYTHVSFQKAVIPYFNESKHVRSVELVEKHGNDLIERIVFTSFTAVASACMFILPALKEDYGANLLLNEFWKVLREGSLMSKAFWNIYPRKILR